MSLAIATCSSAFRQPALARIRALHSTAPARSAHGHYHHLPFNFPGQHKAAFAVKLTTFMTFGFSLPFLCASHQLKKAGGN